MAEEKEFTITRKIKRTKEQLLYRKAKLEARLAEVIDQLKAFN